ncbi:MAG TPA: hypothetical protein VFT01_08565 [Homoserinimonas sp.]|nr:hypothetical protein [Homoserinimonas sp.]
MHIDDLVLNALGFAATGFSIFMWIPQARTTWQNRNDALRLAGISETTQWLLMIGYLLWGIYGVMSESFWVAAPSVVSFPLALATIVLIHRGRRLPPATRAVSIISMTEPLSVGAMTEQVVETTTASIPIISTEAAVAVGETTATDSFPNTGTVPILA